jgi:hypothetical protein
MTHRSFLIGRTFLLLVHKRFVYVCTEEEKNDANFNGILLRVGLLVFLYTSNNDSSMFLFSLYASVVIKLDLHLKNNASLISNDIDMRLHLSLSFINEN